VPKIGRFGFHSLKWEQEVHWLFRMHARQHLSVMPNSDWEWMTLAQHHGLPTRLLDWTRNPLVAAFFSAEAEPRQDGAIHRFVASNVVGVTLEPDPFKVSESKLYLPDHISPRIAAQAGVLTIQKDPTIPISFPNAEAATVAKSFKSRLLSDLATYGVHRGSLFPDLDGQAAYVQWYKTHDELGKRARGA